MSLEIEAQNSPFREIIQTHSVLVADDDELTCIALEACLAKWNFHVTTVTSGLDAWRELQKANAPNLLILDWMMPGISGIDLCRRIRARKSAVYPYILLLTAREGEKDLVEGLDAGADDYLTKPFNPNELRARLNAGRRILCLQNELRKKEQDLSFQARHDSLTGLWNRGAIMDFLEQEGARARRAGTSVGVLLIDIDHFKSVNDTHGHQAGDDVLRQVAQRLPLGIRRYDWVGRYGGEEFLAVIADCNPQVLARCAERLRTVIGTERMRALDNDVEVTVSVGGALYSPADAVQNADDCLQHADAALYRAKQNGRNRVELAETGIHTPALTPSR